MSYTIYDHISPSGKHYIGQTKMDPTKRWGKGGKNYLQKNKKGLYNQPLIANAIQKYGWDNIKHKILFTDLSLQDANMIEEDLIYYYHKLGKSYNIRTGGDNTTKLATKDPKISKREYYQRNKEKENKRSAAWHLQHKDEMSERNRIYDSHRDPEKRKAWYAANRERRTARAKEIRELKRLSLWKDCISKNL